MEHSFILLLLGLAILLATGSSLLATSGSGREDNGDQNSPSASECPSQGEISGSASVTDSGELWLTIYIDQLSILAKIEVVDGKNESSRYKFSVASIDFHHESPQMNTPDKLPEGPLEAQFETPDEAVSTLVSMFQKNGIVFTDASKQSIPFAVHCGWRSPKECKDFVQQLLENHETK